MSYSPPNTFVNGTTLTAADMEGNFEALRLYLHEGIAVGDMAAVQWVDSRHIQPARYDAFTGVLDGTTTADAAFMDGSFKVEGDHKAWLIDLRDVRAAVFGALAALD